MLLLWLYFPSYPLGWAEAADTAAQPGAELIAGTWKGTAGVPFLISVSFYTDVYTNGTAQFSGTVSSSLSDDSTFSTKVSWKCQGDNAFIAEINGIEIPVSCDGKTLTFSANPYELGLSENTMADQEFVITLKRA